MSQPNSDAACCNGAPDDRALARVADEEMDEGVAAIRAAGFHLLLTTGVAVERDVWVHAAGIDDDAFTRALGTAIDRGRVELDADGRLLGIAGLTITPTSHRIEIEGATRWTWCALDAVGILGAMEAEGSVRSSDPSTGDVIEIAFTDGIPTSDVAMFVPGGYSDSNVMESWCPRVNFFVSKSAARAWADGKGFEGDVVSVASVAPEAAEIWRPVVGGVTQGPS